MVLSLRPEKELRTQGFGRISSVKVPKKDGRVCSGEKSVHQKVKLGG